ncbi:MULTISPECIES: hypothetical protein [unclassified Paenibacillus]|uniref:hypothetical protein n=1 Tax=unclassified Paenibacillus TaxID=185978 RepID=UPI0036366EA2
MYYRSAFVSDVKIPLYDYHLASWNQTLSDDTLYTNSLLTDQKQAAPLRQVTELRSR